MPGISKVGLEAEAPPLLDEAEGWTPYPARGFLAPAGTGTDDFIENGHDGERFGERPGARCHGTTMRIRSRRAPKPQR
ncbi:MAG: hypothetical protein OXF07_10700, partial [Rhodobacter sp.]|nr:hypothetical protein [Rhodobacter sp.]MCY4166762.1 hypothetical protein [Rhodobacter sp.]